MLRRLAITLFVLAAWAAPGRAEPLRLAMTDAHGAEAASLALEPLRQAMRTLAGLDVTLVPVSHRMHAAQLMAQRRVDVVFAGPAEYVVLQRRTGAVTVAGLQRSAYHGVIAVRADSAIHVPADLAGAQIGLGTRGSTSRHLAPLQLLAENGLHAGRDFKAQHLKAGLLLEGLKRGEFAAIGVNSSDFARMRAPGAELEVRALLVGPELPMDVLAMARDAPPEARERLRAAIAAHGPALAEALARGTGMEPFRGMLWRLDGLDDSLFDGVRRMFATAGAGDLSRLPE